MDSIRENVWKAAEDLIGLSEELEASGQNEAADRLRNIVGMLENWTVDERLPHGYAEIEYEDFESAEAIEGAKWDDMNFMRYMER